MEILKEIFSENCFDNNVIISYKLFVNENVGKVTKFLEKHDNNLTKIFIDSINDLEYKDNKQWRIIHFICCYSTPEMIKYIIDKGVDLECETNDKWRPIHLICRYSTSEMIKYIIDKGVDLECENNDRWRPIHIICRYSTSEMIKYIIDRSVDLECEDNEKWRPIHIICRYSTLEIIKYLVDYGVELNIKNNFGKLPVDYVDDKQMQGYIRAHMMYQSRDSEELMIQQLQDKNELYQTGFHMAIKKLFGKCNKNARK